MGAFGTVKGAITGFKLQIKPEMDEEGRIYIKASLKQYKIDIIKPKYEGFPLSLHERFQFANEFGNDIRLNEMHYFFTTDESERKAILLDDFVKVAEINVVREISCEEKRFIPKVPRRAVKAYAEATGQNVVVIHTPPVVRGCKPKRKPKIICLFEA